MNTQEALLKAAVPSLATELVQAGGTVPNLNSLATSAIQKSQEEFLKSVSEDVVVTLQAFTALVDGKQVAQAALEKSLAANQAEINKLTRAKDYFASTNNLFPLRKLIGIPTSKDILARFPKIDEVPEDYVVGTAATAPATTTAAA